MSKIVVKIFLHELENDWNEKMSAEEVSGFYSLIMTSRGICDHFKG